MQQPTSRRHWKEATTMANPHSPDTAGSPAASVVVAALERAWQQIRTYHPELPQVIVIVAAGGETARGLFKWGHFAAGRWHVAGTNRPEVLVGGEGLRRPAREVLGTLLHEAAHGLAHARRIQDTSRQGRYHNRRYADLARELGLHVDHDPRIGWSITQASDATLIRYAATLADLEPALVLWRHAEMPHGRTANSRNLLACACGCGRRIRVARSTLDQAPIVCGACDGLFESNED
jgi:hypothetical protein